MMKLNKYLLVFSLLYFSPYISWAKHFNNITTQGASISLDKNLNGKIIIKDELSGKVETCNIKNWNKRLSTGGGIISLTSDNIGLLIYPENKYIKINDILACKGKAVVMNDIPDITHDIDLIVDINFEKKLLLSVIVTDAQSSSYKAIVSHFNLKENLFSGKGFWDYNNNENNTTDNSFYMGDLYYVGKISYNGKYVSPNDLDCTVDAFPGVWDIEKKKKVAFESNKDDQSIDDKCSQLFSGKKSLSELGGKLVSSK